MAVSVAVCDIFSAKNGLTLKTGLVSLKVMVIGNGTN